MEHIQRLLLAAAGTAAAAAGCVAAAGIKGLDMYNFEHLQECLIVEGVFFTYALLHVEGRGHHLIASLHD